MCTILSNTINHVLCETWDSFVLAESCSKETALKDVETSAKSTPYRRFCCPVSSISTLFSANIPVSPRFLGEFDRSCSTARQFEKQLIPSSKQLTKTLKALLHKAIFFCKLQRNGVARH